MKTIWVIISRFFNPFVFFGVALFIIGIILTPFLIGIPIAFAGWLMAIFGMFYYSIQAIPGGQKVIDYVKGRLKFSADWYGKVFKEAFKK